MFFGLGKCANGGDTNGYTRKIVSQTVVPIASQKQEIPWNYNTKTSFSSIGIPTTVKAGPYQFKIKNQEAIALTKGSKTLVSNSEITTDQLVFLHSFNLGQGIKDWRLATKVNKNKYDLPPTQPTVLFYEVHYRDSTT